MTNILTEMVYPNVVSNAIYMQRLPKTQRAKLICAVGVAFTVSWIFYFALKDRLKAEASFCIFWKTSLIPLLAPGNPLLYIQ